MKHLAICACLVAACAGSAFAGTSFDTQSQAVPTASSGETRALIVFVKFKDDRDPGDPCLDARGWPLTGPATQLPTFANSLLASSPEPPFADSTLTAYFHQQSGGQFTLYGDVYPNVVTTRHPTSYYHRKEKRGYGYLTKEILEQIDDEVDFARYDSNPVDGVVDQIFIVVRRDPEVTFTGVANLYGADRVSGKPADKHLTFDGVTVDWRASGTYITHQRPGHIISQPYYVRLMAHEFGHHLWNSRGHFHGGHIKPIQRNQIPANGTDRIGYVLMAGRGGAKDSRGDMLISAFERELLGWAKPRILDSATASEQTLTIGDSYLTGDVYKIWLSGDEESINSRALYIENRQRTGPFSQRRVHKKSGCRTFEIGLARTTGLLIMLVEKRGRDYYVDMIPADNSLELSIEDDTYTGDLFGPGSSTQLTPWSLPVASSREGAPSMVAIDDIRNAEGDAMSFRFVPDFRSASVIRQGSTIRTADSDTVKSRSIRTLDDVDLSLAGTKIAVDSLVIGDRSIVTIEQGSMLVLPPNGYLEMGARSRLIVNGTLFHQGIMSMRRRSRVILDSAGLIEYRGEQIRTNGRKALDGKAF